MSGCYRVSVDRASGALDGRAELAAVLDQVRPGDTLVVWRLDRLGRSLRRLIEVVTGLVAVPARSRLTMMRSSSRRPRPACRPEKLGQPFTRWSIRKLVGFLADNKARGGEDRS